MEILRLLAFKKQFDWECPIFPFLLCSVPFLLSILFHYLLLHKKKETLNKFNSIKRSFTVAMKNEDDEGAFRSFLISVASIITIHLDSSLENKKLFLDHMEELEKMAKAAKRNFSDDPTVFRFSYETTVFRSEREFIMKWYWYIFSYLSTVKRMISEFEIGELNERQVNFFSCSTNLSKDIALAIEEIFKSVGRHDDDGIDGEFKCEMEYIIYQLSEMPWYINRYMNGWHSFWEEKLARILARIRVLFQRMREGYLMIKDVRKAIKINNHSMDRSLTSTMVGDVFYVVQSCCYRSISTSNLSPSVINKVLGRAERLLLGEYKEALLKLLDLCILRFGEVGGGGGQDAIMIDIVTILNDMDMSREYAVKLCDRIEARCATVFLHLEDRESCEIRYELIDKKDRENINKILSDLKISLINCFSQILSDGFKKFALCMKDHSVFNNVKSPEINYELTEAEYAEIEGSNNWVHIFLHEFHHTFLEWVEPLVTDNNFYNFIDHFIGDNLELIMRKKLFNPLGGQQLAREVTALQRHFVDIIPRSNTFVRLKQMATFLYLKDVSEIMKFFHEDSVCQNWKIEEVREVVRRRLDFNVKTIDSVKL